MSNVDKRARVGVSQQPAALTVGLAEAICARPRMEDRHAVSVAPDGVTIVAVFDGHGGSRVAEAAAGRVVDVVASSVKRDPRFTGNAWAQIFAALDTPAPSVGSTATVLCLVPPMLHVAHVGDSRALLVRPATHLRLTLDHREETPSERARILAAGGEFRDGYVVDPRHPYRGLMVTRALGDKELEPAGVIATPEITAVHTHDALGFVLTTDGLWDMLGPTADAFVARALRRSVSDGLTATTLAEWLVALVVDRGGRDNVTVAVGLFANLPSSQ